MTGQFVPKGAVYRDQDQKKDLESRNGIIQVRYVLSQVAEWDSKCQLTPEVILELQRIAVNQVYRCAGHFRDGPVVIQGVDHQPPHYESVRGLVEEMCRHVIDNWAATAVYLASYTMWRVNWIHPFFGGNGRTARAVSYLVLCAKLGFVLPGVKSIPELIVENRDLYYAALREADEAWAQDSLNVQVMEELLGKLLAQQLLMVHEIATGPPTATT